MWQQAGVASGLEAAERGEEVEAGTVCSDFMVAGRLYDVFDAAVIVACEGKDGKGRE